MKELKIGIIGYGGRISHFSKMMRKFGVPMKIQAVADPRLVEIKALNDEHLKGTNFYPDADSLLAAEKFDGIMIGTRCFMHTDMAIKAAKHKVPLFVEKPVGISLEQLRRLDKTFKNYKAPVVVSFPLRLSPLVTRAKEIIKEGLIGTVENFDGFN
ncbi:MAG: Gfo/Idh/MocA family oxidoreductase, partial [Candidatus Firestonebacteria bacterium]